MHGERVYYRGALGVAIGPAAPFERKPITYERAYGGKTADLSILEERNPVGRGIANRAADLIDTLAPQIEDPLHPIKSASDHFAPVGLGAIPLYWQPRRTYFGTADQPWQKTRMPFIPLDFDPRANNVAHPSLVFAEGIPPKAEIGILGMHENGLVRFQVPALRILMTGRTHDGRILERRPTVDTILVEPNRGRFALTLRAIFPMGRGRTILREVRALEEG